jgi:hypothetical protein
MDFFELQKGIATCLYVAKRYVAEDVHQIKLEASLHKRQVPIRAVPCIELEVAWLSVRAVLVKAV